MGNAGSGTTLGASTHSDSRFSGTCCRRASNSSARSCLIDALDEKSKKIQEELKSPITSSLVPVIASDTINKAGDKCCVGPLQRTKSGALAVEAKMAMDEQRRKVIEEQALQSSLSDTAWDWAHDGTHIDGKLTLLPGGQVQWDDGEEQGSWKYFAEDTRRVRIVFNNINHLLRLEDCGSHAILEEPARNPASRMFLQDAASHKLVTDSTYVIAAQDAEYQRSLLHDQVKELAKQQQLLRQQVFQLRESLETADQGLKNAELRMSRYGENPRLRHQAERAREAKEAAQQELQQLEPSLAQIEAEAHEKEKLLAFASAASVE